MNWPLAVGAFACGGVTFIVIGILMFAYFFRNVFRG